MIGRWPALIGLAAWALGVCVPAPLAEAGAEPPASAPLGWTHVVCLRRPTADPLGHVWMFRKDRSGQVSRWDGRDWAHVEVPFKPERVIRALADDCGHVLFEMISAPEGKREVSLEGVKYQDSIAAPLAEWVQAGARAFLSPDFVGPVVTKGGRIWWAYRGYDSIHAYLDGHWERLNLTSVLGIAAGQDGQPLFLTPTALWEYRGGRLVRLSPAGSGAAARMRILGRPTAYWRELPYYGSLPASFQREHLVVVALPEGGYVPVGWEDAAAVAAGQPARPPAGADKARLTGPRAAVGDGQGGFWILDGDGGIWRWFGGCLLPAELGGPPPGARKWLDLGPDGRGGLWVYASQDAAGH
ncbi:MAG: hypothetical protein AMJ81_11560, partial [Phycisphaerae bacterium SM23_33]